MEWVKEFFLKPWTVKKQEGVLRDYQEQGRQLPPSGPDWKRVTQRGTGGEWNLIKNVSFGWGMQPAWGCPPRSLETRLHLPSSPGPDICLCFWLVKPNQNRRRSAEPRRKGSGTDGWWGNVWHKMAHKCKTVVLYRCRSMARLASHHPHLLERWSKILSQQQPCGTILDDVIQQSFPLV